MISIWVQEWTNLSDMNQTDDSKNISRNIGDYDKVWWRF